MRIQSITWQEYHIPFRHALATGHGVTMTRSGALVYVSAANGRVGRGDLAPLPEFGTGDLASNVLALQAQIPALVGKSVDDMLASLSMFTIPAPVRFALETALLDLLGQERGVPIHVLMRKSQDQLPKRQIAVNGLIGIMPLADTVQSALCFHDEGYQSIKMKLRESHHAEERDRIAAVRQAIGPAMSLRLDANGTWSMAEARAFVNACAPFDIEYIEQPLRPDAIDEMAQLRATSPISIAADEGAVDPLRLQMLIDQQCVDVLVLKPTCLGGLQVTKAIIEQAALAGIQCVLSSAIETGIGVAAQAHLAAVAPVHLVSGLATLPLLSDDLINGQLAIRQGMIAVPQGAGLGIDENVSEKLLDTSAQM